MEETIDGLPHAFGVHRTLFHTPALGASDVWSANVTQWFLLAAVAANGYAN
jgi:hypothetical protein